MNADKNVSPQPVMSNTIFEGGKRSEHHKCECRQNERSCDFKHNGKKLSFFFSFFFFLFLVCLFVVVVVVHMRFLHTSK